jgi:hypothetical protein
MSSQTSADDREKTSREGSAVLRSDETVETKAQVSSTTTAQPPATPSYPTGFAFGITLFALFISLFCVALDSTIISTAIPRITDQFHALQDVGWYGSSYLLTKCGMWLLLPDLLVTNRLDGNTDTCGKPKRSNCPSERHSASSA